MPRGPKPVPLATRFWAKVRKTDGCWEWTASINRGGYGSLSVMRPSGRWSLVPAHRVSWALHYGAIPDGMLVCHACDNRKCVRPDHLFVGSYTDNMRDAASKGRMRSPKADWTHCKNGHAFTPDNLTRYPGETCRRCLICTRARMRRRYHRNKAKAGHP